MASPQIDNLDVDKLNDADKNEIRSFLSQTQQRSYIQQQTHSLAQVCWTKCVDNINGSKLDKNEESCLANCVNRFMDLNQLTVKHLSSMRG